MSQITNLPRVFMVSNDQFSLAVTQVVFEPYFCPMSLAGLLNVEVSTLGLGSFHDFEVCELKVYPFKTLVTGDAAEALTQLFLTEAGLYRVLLGTVVPCTQALQRWLCTDAVPKIRQTGNYQCHRYAAQYKVHLQSFTQEQWEWLAYYDRMAEMIPLALAGFTSEQIANILRFKEKSGVSVRKRLELLRRHKFIPEKIEVRKKQLEQMIAKQVAL